MQCDDVLARAADLDDLGPEGIAHLAACRACAASVESAREAAQILAAYERSAPETELAAPDADAAWSAVHGDSRGRSLRRGRVALRIAAAVLAAIGVASLLGVRVESSGGGVSLSLPLPFAAADEVAPHDARWDAVRAELAGVRERLDRLAAADAQLGDATAGGLAARDESLDLLLDEVVALRRELVQIRQFHLSLAEGVPQMPRLPDPE